jgi:5-methylcytosine-specific restriction endonuclease McrA
VSRQGKDIAATKAIRFRSKYSKIARDGTLVLAGPDWKEQKRLVYERDKGQCQYCERPADLDYDVLDVHHKLPRGKGGGDEIGNLALAHRHCHNMQHREKQTRFSSQEKTDGSTRFTGSADT